MHELERNLLEEAYVIFYEELNEDTVFDENYFKSLHKRTFESLYEWAGKYRTFNMSKVIADFAREPLFKTILKIFLKDWGRIIFKKISH